MIFSNLNSQPSVPKIKLQIQTAIRFHFILFNSTTSNSLLVYVVAYHYS